VNAVDTTAVVSAVTAILGTLVIPPWLNRRKNQKEQDMVSVVSWQGITTALQARCDSLQKRLDDSEDRHRKQVDDMEAEWNQHRAALKQQIADLMAEVGALRRALAAPRD
jgi:predicted  nucleic acid-binding Zn-ribbon protein